MCKNGEFDLEVKTTATPEIMTAMFDGDGTDQVPLYEFSYLQEDS
jgi:hypothetical protein